MSKKGAILILIDIKNKILRNRYVQKIITDAVTKDENIQVNNEIISSFSQYGEDLILDGILGCKPAGFYIDIGANDPTILSNTKRFYNKGWNGINIEPNPKIFGELLQNRPRDVNLNIGIGPEKKILPFYLLSAHTLSSFDITDAKRNCIIHQEKIVGSVNIQIVPLIDVFEQYAKDVDVDFISIDAEGYELGIIKSNDWNRFRPKLILIEMCYRTKEIMLYFKNNDYHLVFFNSTNGIFLNIRSKNSE